MTVKRYVSPYAAGTESFRSMRDTRGRTVPDPDEGPFYVLASDHEAEVAALKEQLRTERATQARLITAHQAEVAALRADAERNWEAVLDWERWAAEVLTDFRVPFDNHKVALRLGIVQLIHDAALKGEK